MDTTREFLTTSVYLNNNAKNYKIIGNIGMTTRDVIHIFTKQSLSWLQVESIQLFYTMFTVTKVNVHADKLDPVQRSDI